MNPDTSNTPDSVPNPNLPKGFPTEPTSTLAGPRPGSNSSPTAARMPNTNLPPQSTTVRPEPTPYRGLPELPPDDYERPRRRRGGMGCARFIFNCRCIGCALMLLILALIAGSVYVVIYRPPAVWTPVKEWLNVSLVKQEYDPRSYESVSARLNDELASFASGTNSLRISEQDLYTVLNERLGEMGLRDLNVELTPGIVKLYWNIETDNSLPLWMVMESTPDDAGHLVISKLGTERVAAPDFLNDGLMNLVLSGIKLLQGADQNADLVRIAFPFKENIEVKSVQVNLDELVLELNVKTGLEDFF